MTSDQYIGYIGTYTKGDSEGIYSFLLDQTLGKITDIKVAATLDNPTYVTISADNAILYSVVKKGDSGGVAGFKISDSGELAPLHTLVSAGSPPCHVSINKDKNLLLSANYHKGSADSYQLNAETGEIISTLSTVFHEGSGPDPRQEKAHAHFAGFTPDERFAAVIDLGTDELITYNLDNGKLIEKSSLNIKPGSGPRHLVFHPKKQIAYLMTEFSSEVLVLQYDSTDGSFKQIQAISTLPKDYQDPNQGSAIHISSDGKFVYAANRGHDSICLFEVDENSSELSFVAHTSTEGNWPRDFNFDPSERYLIAANQNSSNLALFSRDTETGKLSLLQSNIEIPDPVCVKFLHY